MNNTMEIATGCYSFRGSSNHSVIIKNSEAYGLIDVYTNYDEKIDTVFATEFSDLIKDLMSGKYI